MYSVIQICNATEKTDDFTRKLIKQSDQSIWWGLHIWKDAYEPSNFIESVREGNDSYQHWLDFLLEQDLQEFKEVENDE